MAKATSVLSRRRGRPKKDNTELVSDVWVEWLRTTGWPPQQQGLDPAIRAVVTETRAGRERTTVRSLRARVRAALRDEPIEWLQVLAVAEQRGVPAAGDWWRALLLSKRNLQRYQRWQTEAEAHADHVRRLVKFAAAFDLLDMPVSVINQRFIAHRRLEVRLRRRTKK